MKGAVLLFSLAYAVLCRAAELRRGRLLAEGVPQGHQVAKEYIEKVEKWGVEMRESQKRIEIEKLKLKDQVLELLAKLDRKLVAEVAKNKTEK